MKKKSIPKFVAGLLALGLGMATPAAHGSDSFNFCGGYDQEPNSIVDLPEDNAMHFDPELGYAEYEQFYWNGILRTPGGKRYAYFLIIYQFTVGDYPFQFPVRAAAGAIQDLQTKVMYKDSYFDFSSGQAYPLPTQTGSFDFELSNPDPNSNFHIKATGKNGVDKLEMTFTDGSNVPRIPPVRIGGGVFWRDANWLARINLLHAISQNNVATAGETPTHGYNLLKAELTYTTPLRPNDFGARFLTLGVTGNNLLNDDIRNAVSFKKDEVLMPGRGVRFFATLKN